MKNNTLRLVILYKKWIISLAFYKNKIADNSATEDYLSKVKGK